MPAYDVRYETLAQQVDAQLSTADAIDAKAATFAFVVGGIVFYTLTLGLFVNVYRVSGWEVGPKPDVLERICAGRDSEDAHRFVADGFRLSLALNNPRLIGKARLLSLSILTFIHEVGLLAAAGVSTFLH